MAEIKLTKNELRLQERRLGQLEKYLPTLQLKKAMLQLEVNDARQEIERSQQTFIDKQNETARYAELFSATLPFPSDKMAMVSEVQRRYENIAGIEVPYFESITFVPLDYSLFETPPWVDALVIGARQLAEWHERVNIAKEKYEALERELREVSIRVNLFEKVLIPRAKRNIKKIRVFLGDLQLAAVSQAKVAKKKIESR